MTSPLLKVQHFQKGMEWTDRVNETIQHLNGRMEELTRCLSAWNDTWAKAPAVADPNRPAALPLDNLAATFRSVSFLSRWIAQLRERAVRLAV